MHDEGVADGLAPRSPWDTAVAKRSQSTRRVVQQQEDSQEKQRMITSKHRMQPEHSTGTRDVHNSANVVLATPWNVAV